jgi:microcystin-dependent protein
VDKLIYIFLLRFFFKKWIYMSFRQYGGTNYASKNNIVKSHYTNASNLSVMNKVGQPTSYINFESDISGNLINGAFIFSDNLTVTGTLTANGATTLTSTLDVTGATNLGILTAGATTLTSTLDVTDITTLTTLFAGATTLTSTLDVSGATTLTTLDVTGITTLTTLDVTDITTLDSDLTVAGATTLTSTLDVTGITTLTTLFAGATTLTSTLEVSGATTLNSGLTVTSGNTSLVSLGVTDITNLYSTLGVSGATTLTSTLSAGATTLTSTLDVSGVTTLTTLTANGHTNLNSTLEVTDITTLDSDLTVHGATTLNGSLTVEGTTNLQNGLSVSSGNTSFSGSNFSVTSGNANFQITINDIQIISPATPLNPTSVVTKNYVDNYVDIAIPIGGIIMWNNTTIPTNWHLCDGTESTPDLQDKFVYGYGTFGSKNIGNYTDGQTSVTLTTAEIPAHTHSLLGSPGQSEFGTGSGQSGAQPLTTNITTGSTGQSQPHNNMPPYYVLAFIMRIA